MSAERWRCDACQWEGVEDQLLRARNPFDPNDEVHGCPACKSVDLFVRLCDEPGCKLEASCGWPSYSKGYRMTCHGCMIRGREAADNAPSGWVPSPFLGDA